MCVLNEKRCKKPYNFSENIKKLALNICQELLVEKIDEL